VPNSESLPRKGAPDRRTRGQLVCTGALGMYLKVAATALMDQNPEATTLFCCFNSESPRCQAAGHARADTTESSAQATAWLLARNTAGNILPARICQSLDAF
jgi:hypothetical protein